MEGHLKPSTDDTTIVDAFESACPLFISYGMTYDEFWYGEPERAKYYREAHDLALEQMSFNAYIQGRYVRDAISDFLEFYAMSSRPKVGKNYPEKPYPITEKAAKLAKEKREEEIANRYLAMFKKKDAVNNNGNNN